MAEKKCPECGSALEEVTVFSQCSQVGVVGRSGSIEDYSDLQIHETLKMECRNCNADVSDLFDEASIDFAIFRKRRLPAGELDEGEVRPMVKKAEEKEFFVSMTATAVFDRVVKVRAKSEEDAMQKAEKLWDEEAESGRFDQLDFERGHDWNAWPASEGIGKGFFKERQTYTDYTEDEDGKVKDIEG